MAELGIQQEQQEQQQQQEQNSGETNLLLTEEHAGTQTSDDFQSFPRNPRPAVQQQEAESQSPAVSLIRAPSSASSAVSILSEGVNSANGNGRLAHSDNAITRDGDNDPSSDSDDFVQPPVQAIPRAQPRAHEAETEATEEQLDTQPDSTSDERNACPICFEKWTISGNHQLTALKCGHLFGKSCIVKTDIQKNPINTKTGRRRNRIAKNDVVRCPECNQDGKWSEARRIFARSIVAVDDEKLAETRRQASELQKKQGELENDLAHYQLSFQQMRNEVVKLRNRLAEAFKKTQSLELENSNLTRHVGELTQQLLAATTSSCPADRPRPSCNDEVDLLQLNDADLKYIEANAGPGLGKEDNASDRVLGSPAVPERSLAQSRTMSMNSVETVELDAMAGARARTALDHSLGNDGPKAPDGQPTATHTYCPRLRLKATIPLNKGDTSVSSRLMAVHPYDDLVYATYSKRSTNFHTLAQVNVHDPASPPVVLEKMHSDEIRGAEHWVSGQGRAGGSKEVESNEGKLL
ncbi:hypothetical protein GGI12_002097 [Dipsacomyces acuminosporus]|nr:hypothetical protein GGI12_002097 [Dipsacomyces acuminosporus]